MYLVGDIGGTKTRLALIKENFKQQDKIFDEVFISATPSRYELFLDLISQFLKKFRKIKIEKACFGFAGNFDSKKEKLIYAPNLKDYVGRNLKRDLEKILKTKVILENDAALAGLGEAYFGSGKDLKSFGYLTLSSGIGGVKIINKKISDNIFGFEPGHSFLLLQSKTDYVLPFEIEELIGGKNLEKIFGKKPEKIKDKRFWDDLNKILAIFLVNVSIFWSVDKIILGGGLIKSLGFKKLNFYVNKLHPLPIKIKIIKSKLKDLVGLYGGLVLLKYGA